MQEWELGDPSAPRQTLYETRENISDAEFNDILKEVETLQTATRKDYVKEYYTDKKDKYISKEFTTTDGVKYTAETYGGRKPLQSEIDASAYLTKRGHSVVFLDEETGDNTFTAHPDILVDNKYLFEIKAINSSAIKTIVRNIKKGTKKGLTDVPVIYWNSDNSVINVKEIQETLNEDLKKDGFVNQNFNYACVFQNGDISVVENKNKEARYQIHDLATTPLSNYNLQNSTNNVKSETEKTVKTQIFSTKHVRMPHLKTQVLAIRCLW